MTADRGARPVPASSGCAVRQAAHAGTGLGETDVPGDVLQHPPSNARCPAAQVSRSAGISANPNERTGHSPRSSVELPRFGGHLNIASGRTRKESVVTSRNRRKFTPEFKAEAVEMVDAAGGNIAQVAKELGVYDSTLGNWVRDARERAKGAPTSEERQEIRELRRELERTRRERDILAKAVAFFSGSPKISE